MQSNQNTFRLGRLSHTSDFRKPSISEYNNNPKQTLKFAALTSINRGVKYNDLSFITGRELPKLRKQPQESNDNLEYNAAHQNLTSIRRKHDNINKQKNQVQAKIKLLKEEKQKYTTTEDQFLGNKTEGSEKVKNKEEQLTNIKTLFDEAEWTKKEYQMMAERIRHDKIVYDQRKFNLDKQLSHLKKQLKIFIKQGTGINQQTDRTAKVYEKLIKQLQNEQKDRDDHIKNLENMLNEREYVNQSNQIRKNQIQEIASKASQQKDENQKHWINILHVHKFVEQLLRAKMNREMQKFSIVEMAFKNIKIATGVSDAQTLISKYLTKEAVYGQLLGKIADNQRRITELKSQNDELLKDRKTHKEQKRANDSTKKSQINLRQDLKLYEEVNSKYLIAELNSQKLRSWIIKNLKKIFNIEKSNEDASLGRSYKQIGEGFKNYLKKLSLQLDKCNQLELVVEQGLNNSEIVSENSKVFRVKPKTKKINYSGEQIQNEFQDQQITNASEEQDIVANQRNEIIKQNEKFMKELKRKMQETKKLKIQANESKQKKPNASPQKKPAHDQ